MRINKKQILDALKADLKASDQMRLEWFNKINEWKNETSGQPYGNEVHGKSRIVSKDIKKQLEWMLPTLADPFLSTPDIIKCNPITYEDVEAARQNEVLLNTQFCRKFPRYNFIMKSLKVLATEGTLVIQTGWDYEDAEVETMVEAIVEDPMTGEEFITMMKQKSTVVKRNQPTAVVCRNEDIFIDPTCMDDIDKCQFVIHRYETDLSTLKSDGRYKNLDKIVAEGNNNRDYGFYPEDKTYFDFADDARKKLVVYEYWGNYDVNGDGIAEPIVCAWVGNTIIRLQSNPYPDKKPPFIIVPFNAVPFQMHGESLASVIGDNQKVKTAIVRGIIDNMAQSNNGQIGLKKGALDMANRKKFLSGKNFEYNGVPSDFWQGSYNQIPGSAFDMLSIMNNEIESQTGVKSFSGGINASALGHMLDINTDIPMIDGSFKKLAHIEDGDLLVGSDGKATKVLKAHEIKFPEVAYDMHFDNGSVVKSGGEHLWTVKVHGTKHSLREWTTMSADEVYKYIQKGKRVTIPAMKEMHAGVPTGNNIDPYVLGYWLGDGMSHSARITTEDTEVLSYFRKAGYECVEVRDSSKCGNAKMYDVYKIGYKPQRCSETGQFTSTGSLHSELRELGVLARYGGEKHIPEEYFTATYEEKMELIRGLMDSDGYAHSGSFVQFCQSESRLKDDMIKLIESLGLKASIVKRHKEGRNKQKIKLHERTGCKLILATKDSYEVGFTPWSNPFKLSRKAQKWKLPSKQTVTLKSMEIVDKVLMRCLTVDSEDKLFAVTDKFTLTHNTATGARGALDATATRRMSLVRNIAENLIKPLMRKWMAYNSEFLEEEEVIRITNDEFVPIRRDDLDGKIDIDISISTAEDNSAKAQELSFLLQTMGPNQDFELNKMLMAEIARLSRMPQLEKQIKAFQPQQDPMAEQLKQLELMKLQKEIELLDAGIHDKRARAGENEIDARVKLAKMETEMAKARKLGSEADMTDLDFLLKNEGMGELSEYAKQENEYAKYMLDREHKLEDDERNRSHELDKMMLKGMMDMETKFKNGAK